MSKTLVTYFSASGVTAGKAKTLADLTDAQLYEIKPETPYTSADLDWRNKQSRSSVEMQDKSSRPAIVKDADISDYDTIFIGFPVWWYTAPTIINTFIEAYNFSGKTIIPFATSGSSGVEKCVKDLQAAYPDLTIQKGKLLNGSVTGDTLKGWIE